MENRIPATASQLADYCRRWKITTLALFGSALRDDFNADSDIDILVRFRPDSGHSLFDLVRMQDELTGLFGRNVDLVSWRAIEQSTNPYRKKAILESAQVLYAA